MTDLDVSKMQKKIQELVEARDWAQFHTPKNIAISLSLEASELLENFQWLKEDEAVPTRAIADEMADVFYWLLRMSDVLKIDLGEAFWEKIKKSEAKYPVELAKGNAKKYTEFLK